MEHIPSVLTSFHWLPVYFTIDFWGLMYVFKSLNRLSPTYFANLWKPYATSRPLTSYSSMSKRQDLRLKGESSYLSHKLNTFWVHLWNKLFFFCFRPSIRVEGIKAVLCIFAVLSGWCVWVCAHMCIFCILLCNPPFYVQNFGNLCCLKDALWKLY